MPYLIVDGHSVIFGWPDLRKLQAKRPAHARQALIKALTDYQDGSGVRVVVVFDGKGGKISDETEPGGIQVFYSPQRQTADQIIERLTAKYAATHDITVVTADRLEQQTVISFGGHAISPDELQLLLAQARADLARRLGKHRSR
jgi:predicted RNA-binding protein with PIN domain